MKEKTAGQLIWENLERPSGPVNVIDQQQEMVKDYMEKFNKIIQENKSKFKDVLYLVILLKTDYLLPGLIRPFFFLRQSAPTPHYHQSVFKYTHNDDKLELLWTLPNKESCLYLYENAITLDENEKTLLQYIIDFYNGTLLQKAQLLNNEEVVAISN